MTDNNFSVDIKGFKELPSKKLAESWENIVNTANSSPGVKKLASDNGVYIGSSFFYHLWIFFALLGFAFLLWQVYDGKFLTSYSDNSVCNSQSNSTSSSNASCGDCNCGSCNPSFNCNFNQTNIYLNNSNST